ncbi:MAG TPA: hypothetical protein VNV86_20090, partial [Candidatus Acidoferrum sp.]|nr:hypothetical protein [Candidatus Acidoferrum sp.]
MLLAGIASTAAALPPSITSASPNPIDAGGPYFAMTVTGTGFVAGSGVNLGRTPLSTAFVSSTQLKAAITPELRRFSGEYDLTVGNPDGSISRPYPFLISPVIATVAPAAVLPGSSAVDITVTGIGFILPDVLVLTVSGQRITLTATLVNSGTLTATVPASALAVAAAATIEVLDPRYGGVSAQLPFSIVALPVITSASPNPIDAGGPYFLMTITGANFVPGASVNLSGTALGTSFVSSTQLQVAITPEVRALSGTFDLTVTEPGGITSGAFAIAISPVLASVTPVSAIVGGPPVPITVTGIGFTRNNVLAFTASGQTSRLTTTYVNSNTLSATIPQAGLTASGAAALQVIDTTGSDVSASIPFAVRIAPAIASASPNLMDAGGPGLVMTVNGSGFIPGS